MAFINVVLPRLNIAYASADERAEALAVFGFDEDFEALGLTVVGIER